MFVHKVLKALISFTGFNPMWEETLVFTLHMSKIALVRFMVWDHDPIGRDFIGQRTIAFTSLMQGISLFLSMRISQTEFCILYLKVIEQMLHK